MARLSDRERFARAFAGWCRAESLWQRRAALVSLVRIARHGDANFAGFSDLVLETASVNATSPERFLQTAVGWALRELPEAARELLEEHTRAKGPLSRSKARA
jgi:3-methyladenine DNA glycosylase AlkD